MKNNLNRLRAYLRLRAFLRIKVRYKRFEFRSVAFLAILYLVLSLGIFILPNDILTRYPFLKHFTDFMDFIPAVSLLESKSFAPELCKFYASYMLVVGIGFGILTLIKFLTLHIIYLVRPYSSEILKVKALENANKHSDTLMIIYFIMALFVMIFVSVNVINGGAIGFNSRGANDGYIDTKLEMLSYVLFQGMMILVWVIYITAIVIYVSEILDSHLRNKAKAI